jgi:molybdopterin-guanine dinucleotide biosynthesis protein A
MNIDIAVAVLAGGKNTRMGKDKAFIKIEDGISLIQKNIRQLKQIFKEVVIVTNSPEKYGLYKKDTLIVTDIIKDKGPLGGIHSALSHISGKSAFFIACDMPFLHNGIIEKVISYFNNIECDALVPKIGPYIEPLHAVYKTYLKDKLESFLKENNNYSIRNFFRRVNVKYLDLQDSPQNRRVFKNINSPGDLEEIKEGR